MFLTERKLERRIDELKEYRYREMIHLESFLSKEDGEKKTNPKVPADMEGWEVMNIGDTWKGRDKYLWLYRELSIPEEWSEKKVLGIFDFGNTGAGNNSGFESLLYLNGAPYQGVDMNHKEVFFKKVDSGTQIKAHFRLWSGLEGGGVPKEQEHRFNRADLAWLDENADDLYYLGSVVLDTVRCLREEDPTRQQLLKTLDAAFLMIDWSYPGGDVFYDSVRQADDLLNERISAMDKTSLVEIDCVGHTHIDVAWLWRLKNTREKCSRSFSTVLRLMEQYPEYIFLQTQPQLYDYIKRDFPEIYEGIRERIREGRWEADGGMWVEADCNLTSGESLTRQLLIGSRFFKEEFGKEVKYLWLPDVFGYSWALPQILKKSGIDTFMTTKISWNQYNRMPHDTFKWKGIDGSEVLTHFITTPAPWQEEGSWFYTYNGELIPKTVKGTWDAYTDKGITNNLLIAYGHGDGGGGVNRDMLERRRRIDLVPGMPALKQSTAGAYFERLKKTVDHTDQYVHTWDGELYLEYHRGTYTSHAYNKRMNRKMEYLYRKAEWLTVMGAIMAGDITQADQEGLTEGWKILLTNQFHDIIPGSSIKEVYDDSRIDYEKAQDIALELEKTALRQMMEENEGCAAIWNCSPWNQTGLVKLSWKGEHSVVDEAGNSLPIQETEDGMLVKVEHVPAMGYAVVRKGTEVTSISRSDAGDSPFSMEGHRIETPFYVIELNEKGQICRLYDREHGREVLPEGKCANVLQMFEDKPVDNDAWDIDIFYQQKMWEVSDLTVLEVKEEGPLFMRIHMEWSCLNSSISQDMVLYEGNRRIDFETTVDYHETHLLLKAAFPVDVRTTYATYDIQYGNVRRPNHWNTSWDQARFESVAHKWVDLSERDYGISLLNDCKYGHDVKDNVLRISLIKAATHPDFAQDQGFHEFTYSLLPHVGDFVEGRTEQEAFALNQPLFVTEGKPVLPYRSFLTVTKGNVALDAVKRSEDRTGFVIRIHEYTGSSMKVGLEFGIPIKTWRECDLMERPVGGECREQTVTLDLKPYEIKTVLVSL